MSAKGGPFSWLQVVLWIAPGGSGRSSSLAEPERLALSPTSRA
jgi:hypothetical protein